MTNSELLKKAIDEAGVTITFLAKRLHCSRNRIYAILAGADCNASEIVGLSESLHLSAAQRDQIFLSEEVIENH